MDRFCGYLFIFCFKKYAILQYISQLMSNVNKKFKCFCLNCLFFEFRVETIDGSANEGEDYEPLNEILTFEPNETEKEVSFFFIFPWFLLQYL